MNSNYDSNIAPSTSLQPSFMRLDQYHQGDYTCGAPLWKQLLWYYFGSSLVRSYWIPFSTIKVLILRAFGANIGSQVRIKPGVRVKFPWRISIGDHSWIGEDCWLDSNAQITVGEHVCLSQGVYLCTGNHDWKSVHFTLRCQPIEIQSGSWICAQSKVGPGVTIGAGAVLTLGSVTNQSLQSNGIYSGNPAQFLKQRVTPPQLVPGSSQDSQGVEISSHEKAKSQIPKGKQLKIYVE